MGNKTATPHAPDTAPLEAKPSHWEKYLGDILEDYIVSGLTVTAAAGLSVDVAVGRCYVKGIICELDTSSDNVAGLTDATTNYLYIQLTRNGASEVLSWQYVVNTTGANPGDAILIAKITTAGGVVTGVSQTVTDSIYSQLRVKPFYVSGDIRLQGNRLRTTNLQLYEASSTLLSLEDSAGSANRDLLLRNIRLTNIKSNNDVTSMTIDATTGDVNAQSRLWSNFVASSPTFNGTVALGTSAISGTPTFNGLVTHNADLSIGANKIKTNSVDYLSRVTGTINLETTAAATSNTLSIWGTVSTVSNLNARLIIAAKGQPDVSGVFEHLRIEGYYEDHFAINVVQNSSALRALKLQMGGADMIILNTDLTIDLNNRAVRNFFAGSHVYMSNFAFINLDGMRGRSDNGGLYIYAGPVNTGFITLHTRNAGADVERLKLFGNAPQGSALIISYEPFQFEKYLDLKVITEPASPSAGYGRMYAKQVDADNDNIFAKVKRGGSVVEMVATDSMPELARTILAAPNATIAVSFTAKKRLRIVARLKENSDVLLTSQTVTLNNDTGANYYQRYSDNGAADVTTAAVSDLILVPGVNTGSVAGTKTFIIIDIDNSEATVRKHGFAIGLIQPPSDGNPSRREVAFQWKDVTSQITSVEFKDGVSRTYAIGSEVVVYGSD